ncbi:MAG: hypothetical protein VX642_08170 [Bdellovibrionota bacterium]|nr:hypothetical protein [Bdellovibrionota bacterium]
MANNEIDFADYHVLVVSNAPKKYRLVMRQISNAGMTASAMSSIKKALTYVVAKKPTHLFMSANMPKMNAVKVAKLLSTTFNIPVIIYPEDFGYKTTKFLKDCGWPNVMTSTLSGASVMNMLRIMAHREQQTEEGIQPDNAPVDASSNHQSNEDDSENLYAKKARKKHREEDESGESLYARKKKKPQNMTQEEEQEYYAEQARRKRPEFFDVDDEDEDFSGRKKRPRRASTDEDYYDDEFVDESSEYEDEDYDDEDFASVGTRGRSRKSNKSNNLDGYEDESLDGEVSAKKRSSKSRKKQSGEFDDDYEFEDEYEEVDYDSEEDEGYDYEDYEEEYEDESGDLKTRKRKRRRKKKRLSTKAEYSEDDEYVDEDDDFFIDDEDEDDEDLDLASLMKNALKQKSKQEQNESQETNLKKKSADEGEYEGEELQGLTSNKPSKPVKAIAESDDDEYEEYEDEDYEDDDASGEKVSNFRKKRKKRRKASREARSSSNDEDYEDEDSDLPDDLAEFRRKRKRRKKKSGQDIDEAVDDQLEASQEGFYNESDEDYDQDEYEDDEFFDDEDSEGRVVSRKKKSRRRKPSKANGKNRTGKQAADDEEDYDEYDDLIRKTEDPDALKESFNEEQLLDRSNQRESKYEEPEYSKLKPKKSYAIEHGEKKAVKSKSSEQDLEEMLDPSKVKDTSDWDELSSEEKKARDLETFEGAIANAIESLSTEGDSMRVDTSSTRSLVIFAATSEHFNGYLALAAGKNNIVSTELSGPFRKRLLQALRKEGLYLELLDPFYILTDTMSYTAMMKKSAKITHITSHMGEEVGVSFLEVAPSFFEAKYTKSEDQGMYKVNIDSITAGQPVSIDYYIQLKHNKKFIKYVPQGGIFDSEQLERLKKHNVENLCIEDDKVRKWREATASNFFNSQIKKKAN